MNTCRKNRIQKRAAFFSKDRGCYNSVLNRIPASPPQNEPKVFKTYYKHRLRRVLIKITQKAGIEGLTRLHELRHSYATFLLSKGVDIYKIKELLGHSDIRDTMKYAHLPTIYMKNNVKNLEALDNM
ncbi:MAG: tyrosine-type recombinase/integrase [Candidatus Omnitrophota bacterium]|nr:MAG: tyrosine-type recombinase/integrase [Candidatus Omnitrophota bacterium]